MNDTYYKGFRIDSYISARHQYRWIYEEDERFDPVAEFDLQVQHVSVEDCKRIIDGWLAEKTEHQKPEQMKLF